ncbi:FHA domain-containing protein [uncultured Shewanella sp.]|uniref:type VI secretion system-associated FHA domain protein n=1 Tax=uncultured Shewanella sp. TaxID=173975 RepID=UPI00261C101F|nr:FHA domain-containing protein [uncultured Shewanella sp.]
MAISFHVIVVPDAEALGSMTFILPEEGGSIGRGPSNSLMLPDETETISSVHALVRKENNEYILEDISQSGVVINGADKPVGYQNEALIRDGDLLDLGGYRLLVSCFDPQLSEAKPIEKTLDPKVEDPFKNKLDVKDRPVVDRSDLQSYRDPFTEFEKDKLEKEKFSTKIVNEEPEVGIIHNEANDVDHKVQVDPFIAPNKKPVSNNRKSDIVPHFDEIEADPFKSQLESSEFVFQEDNTYQALHGMEVISTQELIHAAEESSLTVGNQVLSFPKPTDSQINCQQNGAYVSSTQAGNNEQLKMQIERALDRFIDDFSPNALERLFNHYHTGVFKVKKQNMWTLYHNYFTRMQNSKEFSAKFWAYFHDN